MTVVSSAPARRAAPSDGYTARHLTVLEGLEAVRKRPGMYIGSTDGRGLLHCLWEIIDNAVDEALAGHGDEIEVVLHPDGSAEVHDHGRGIPVDVEPKTGLTGVELVMTRLHAGGKFGGGSYTASGGLHGVGASVVNALSARLDVARGPGRARVGGQLPPRRARRVRRRRSGRAVRRRARPAQGAPGGQDADRHPDPVLAGPADLRRPTRSGPSTSITQRARQTAYLVPGLAIRVRDDRPPALALVRPADDDADAGRSGPQEATFRFEGGISEFCEHLSPGTPVPRSSALAGRGPVHRDRAGPRRPGPPDADRGGARAHRRRGAALGLRLRHRDPLVRQRHRHPQGRHPSDRLRAGPGPHAERAAAGHQAAQGRRGSGHQGRRDRGPDRGRRRAAARAAVRGPDQGGARHPGRDQDRPAGRQR